MNRILALLLMVPVLLVLEHTAVIADVPHLLNVQGLLTDAEGEPLPDASYSVIFTIYDAETGGNAKWSENRSVTTSGGIFAIYLGQSISIPASLFDSPDLWLGIAVEGEGEMTPRQCLSAVPYVFRAVNADSAGFAFAVANNAIGSDQIVNGSIELSDLAQNGASANQVIKWNGVAWGVGDENISGWIKLGSNIIQTNQNDKVGIGTSHPDYSLTVNGPIALAYGGEVKYHINYYQGGLNFAETGVQDRRIHISDGGNVGIGTANPGAKLGVAGDLKVTGAFMGDISSSSGSDGAPFPRPAYESAWTTISQSEGVVFNHNIGGDVNDYFVDLQLRDSAAKPHTQGYGYYIGTTGAWHGVAYKNLTTSSIEVIRANDDSNTAKVRVRIWVIE